MAIWIYFVIGASVLSVACVALFGRIVDRDDTMIDRLGDFVFNSNFKEEDGKGKALLVLANILLFLIMLFSLPCLAVIYVIFSPIMWIEEKFIPAIRKKIWGNEQTEEKQEQGGENKKVLPPNKYRDMADGEVDWSLASNICFSTRLPFKPNSHQIIYIEDKYNTFLNNYISENEEEIRQYFKERGYEFIYLPTLKKRLLTKEIIDYYNPTEHGATADMGALRSDMLNKYIVKQPECKLGPALIRFCKDPVQGPMVTEVNGEYAYYATYRRLVPNEQRSVDRQIHEYFSYVKDGALYSFSYENECLADRRFNEETAEIMDEIRERVEKLRLCGIEESVICGLFKTEVELSRLVVTKDYRILLPDYDNIEIELKALPKAVYILFLRHPEGIVFKNLPDYRKELSKIYDKVTNRSSIFAVKKSVDDVTNPLKNSINEKCARIHGAFLEKFGETIARHYCITGRRGEAKKISLPRNLVTIECDI